MRRAFGSVIVLISVVVGVAVQGQQAPPPQGGRAPLPPPKNLQVLPKDTTRQQLTPMMRSIAGALGVECTHCHVSMTDQASDEKPTKLVARKMIKMTLAINSEMLKDVGDPAAAGTQRVTCFTCHRGALKPATSASGGH